MSYIGSWKIDDVIYPPQTTWSSAGGAASPTGTPTYRVYENATGTAIGSGNLTAIDAGNLPAFFQVALTLSAANGYEKGKFYTFVAVWVDPLTVDWEESHCFQIEAEVDANVVSDKTGYRLSSTGVDDVLDEVAEADGSITMRQAIMVLLAVSAGQATGGETTTVIFKSPNGSSARVTMTVDDDGNRSSITLDYT